MSFFKKLFKSSEERRLLKLQKLERINQEEQNELRVRNQRVANETRVEMVLRIRQEQKEEHRLINGGWCLWWLVGSGNKSESDPFFSSKIENLPIGFVRRYQSKIDWRHVGSGHRGLFGGWISGTFTNVENLPRGFVREFGHLFGPTRYDKDEKMQTRIRNMGL